MLDGVHLVRAYVDALGAPQEVVIAESALTRPEVMELRALVNDAGITVIADALMAEASMLDSPAYVMAIATTPEVHAPHSDATVLILENLQDPGNVGSLLRSAAAAGVRDVLTASSTAFAWSPKVLRAAQGAHFSLNIVEGIDVAAFLDSYTGTSIALVASGRGVKALYAVDCIGPVAIIVGHEGAGISEAVREKATLQATIPMLGKMESLNAAAAGAIALFEVVRQRSTK